MGMGCRHEPHSSPATGGPLLFVFLNMIDRVTWGLVPTTNYPGHSLITVGIPDEGPIDQAGVVCVLELIRDLEPVVPLVSAAEAESEAEVGPGVGHGRVGEHGVLAHLHHAVLYCTVLYCVVLYCIELYCTILLYCIVLYYIDCTVLYCTVLT